MARHGARRTALAALAAAFTVAAAARGAQITIVNGDGAGTGFNDPAPATPVGGNTGTTVGQQRLIAFQYAADLWATQLESPIEIRVRATFEPLECTADTAVLGAAAPTEVVRDFPHAPFPRTWFAAALGNRLAGEDLNPDSDDIQARFNSSLGNSGCFDGGGWYYGLDNNHGAQTDLVAVLLHEFAHGFGFLSVVDISGQELQGFPDIFERFVFDTTTNRHWDEMTDAERGASAVNTGNLTWDGLTVTAQAPNFLGGTPSLTVTSPPSVARTYEVGTASFGPELTETPIPGAIVAALDAADLAGPAPTDACSTLSNASALEGRIALVDRGDCDFDQKAARVQDAGAIAMIIVNNVPGEPPGMGGDDPTISIPSVSLTQTDGAAIRAALGGGVTARLGLNLRRRSGTGGGGRVLLYAPNPAEQGSSTSHWDTSAFPNLLMEPNLTGSLPHEVDLTLPLFYDIGWRPNVAAPLAAREAVDEIGADGQPRVVPSRPE